MPRSKCLKYNDEQLRILVCITGFGPLAQKELSRTTGIKKGNLSTAVKSLLSQGILIHKNIQDTGKKRGRPMEYLALKSPFLIQEICDELEYRKNQHEIEMKEFDARFIEYWAEWSDIVGDPSKYKDFADKYGEIMRERAILGAEDGSFSMRAIWAEVEGQRTIVVQKYDGTDNALKEISYQGIKYWLRLLQHPVRRILSFFIDNESAIFSKSEIEHGACLYTYPDAFLYTDALSKILSKLEAGAIITATQADQGKKYRLNIANPETKELIMILCLWQKKNAIAAGLRGRIIKKYIDTDTIYKVLTADVSRRIQELKRRQDIETPL
jgi:predicted transcriptional regulator/uncharacterized protein with HEPN domain